MGRTIKVDVAVFGSGPAGVGAALAAARTGARTMLVEKMGALGGQMTSGLVTGMHGYRIHKHGVGSGAYWAFDHHTKQVVGGIAEEMVQRLKKKNAAFFDAEGPNNRVEFDPEALKSTLFEMMTEANVELMLDSFAFGTVMENGHIKAVRIANKNGEELIEAKQYVDATADGDIAAWAGAPYEIGRAEDGRTMPITLYIKLGGVNLQKTLDYLKEHPKDLHNGTGADWQKIADIGGPLEIVGFRSKIQEAFKNNDYPTPIGAKYGFPYPIFFLEPSFLPKGQTKLLVDMAYGIDSSDAAELTKAEIHVRQVQAPAVANFAKKYLPGFEDSYLMETASLIGTRESRRIMGDYVLNEDDILNNRRFPDVVARCGRAMNVHSPTGGKLDEDRGGQYWIEAEDPKGYDIPLRCLIPQKVDNLFVSGRCISVTHMALGSTRGMPVCMATGEAAGTAAALCSIGSVDGRTLDIKKLQGALLGNKVILE